MLLASTAAAWGQLAAKSEGTLCRGLLQSGLGRFGIGPRKPAAQLGSFAKVLIFVVGGVSMADMRAVASQAQEAAGDEEQYGTTPPEILLGGTGLLSPDDVVAHLLA